MNLNRFLVLAAVLVMYATSSLAQNESLSSIFTNSTASGVRHKSIPRRSSIIYIACQGLSLSDLSCYGQTNFQTPNLDRLAAEGTRCTDYHATGGDLATAEAMLMDGNTAPFSNRQPTLAARLQQAGYHTGLIGEWLLGSEPWRQGFDEFGGYLSEQEANNYYSDFIWRYSPNSKVDFTNHTLETWIGKKELYENTADKKGIYIPDLILSMTANFVRNNEPDFANHYRPFFLLVNLAAPHTLTPGRDDYPVPTDAPFSSENWPQEAKNRAALMTRLDDSVGRLMEQLKKIKMTNNVAIFLAGAMAPEEFANTNLNFLKVKGDVRGGNSEARSRVPMIVRWPDHVPAGHVCDADWSTVDFAPTAMEIGYADPVAGYTGTSILPKLFGPSTVPGRQLH